MADETQNVSILEEAIEISEKNTTSNLCVEYKKYQQYNVPLPRFTPLSPYISNPNLTQFDFDMRRKAEVLQYRSLQTQVNGTTKNGKWTQLVQKSVYRPKLRICSNPSDEYLATPTSSSDVPGPVMNLYLDPAVPLYNYTKTYSYASVNPVDNKNTWDYDEITDVIYTPKKLSICFTIIYDSTKKGRTTYSFQTPLSLFISGAKTGLISPSLKNVSKMTVQITGVKVVPLYANRPIRLLQNINVNLPSAPTLEINLSSTGVFSASKFVGNLIVSGILLFTQYQYVYDIGLLFSLNIVLYDSGGSIISGQSDVTLQPYVVSNIDEESDRYFFNETNCSINNPSLPTFVPFMIESSPRNEIFTV